MKKMDEFQKIKTNLIEFYKEIKDSNLIPINYESTEINHETIDELIKNLEEEKFYLSVCGQINSGKSTLLNAMIFGDAILPTNDTIQTAKLTEITFGSKPGFEVDFYSPEEWEALKDEKVEIIENDDKIMVKYYDKYLKEQVKQRINSGINPDNILQKGSIKNDSLSNLDDFIAVRGKYTPFVKKIKIRYPSKILNNITVIDTPGTNDPNIFRSQITDKWIGKSDAVIFLIYAGQPFSRQDNEFIDKHLYTISKNKIIVALTKVDIIEDTKSITKYVQDTIIKSGEGRTSLFKNKKVYPLAPLFPLYDAIYKKYKEGSIELDEDSLEDIKYQLFDRPKQESKIKEIKDKKGYLEQFITVIENHLINDRGSTLINSHIAKIRGIYEANKRKVESQIDINNNLIVNSGKTVEELEQQINNYREEIKTIDEEIKNLNENLFAIKRKLNNKILENLDRILKPYEVKLRNHVRSNSIEELEDGLQWYVRNKILTPFTSNFNDELNKYVKETEEDVNDIISKLKLKFSNLSVIGSRSNKLLSDLSLKRLCDSLSEHIYEYLEPEILRRLGRKILWFRIDERGTKDKYMAEIEKIISEIYSVIIPHENKLNDSIEEILQNQINSPIKEVVNEIEKLSQDKIQSLEELRDKKKENVSVVDKLKSEKSEYEKQMTWIESEKDKFEKYLGGKIYE